MSHVPVDGPDPDAIYEATQGFVSGRVPGIESFAIRTGEKLLGSHPAVVEHFRDGLFRVAEIEDRERRDRAEILALLRQSPGPDVPAAPHVPAAPPAERTAPSGRGPDPDDTTKFEDLDAIRHELARENRAHGYDTIAKRAGVNRSTVQRRYEGRHAAAPGLPIVGVCDAPGSRHPH